METKYTPRHIDTKGVHLPEGLTVLAGEMAKNAYDTTAQRAKRR
jgi:hypothetical protein